MLCGERDRGAFATLFAMETVLRAIVRWEVRGTGGSAWKGLIPQEVTEEAREREQQERELGVLDFVDGDIFKYLTLAELKDFFFGQLWERSFRGSWPAQEILRAEFRKLIAVRNKVAHFRPLTSRDERVILRFSEDMAEATRPAGELQRRSPVIDRHTLADHRAKLDKVGIGGAVLDFVSCADDPPDRDCAARLLAHHVAFSVTLRMAEGVFDEDSLRAVLRTHGSVITFVRLKPPGDSVVAYCSTASDGGRLLGLAQDLRRLPRRAIDLSSATEFSESYQTARSGLFLDWDLELPAWYRGARDV